jgi:hypothetical protein
MTVEANTLLVRDNEAQRHAAGQEHITAQMYVSTVLGYFESDKGPLRDFGAALDFVRERRWLVS